jgi:hypothetical protein
MLTDLYKKEMITPKLHILLQEKFELEQKELEEKI